MVLQGETACVSLSLSLVFFSRHTGKQQSFLPLQSHIFCRAHRNQRPKSTVCTLNNLTNAAPSFLCNKWPYHWRAPCLPPCPPLSALRPCASLVSQRARCGWIRDSFSANTPSGRDPAKGAKASREGKKGKMRRFDLGGDDWSEWGKKWGKKSKKQNNWWCEVWRRICRICVTEG